MDLGAGFYVPPAPVVYDPLPPTLDDLRDEQILVALAALRDALLTMPPPEVTVSAPDLSEIVTAVASLKPGADAEDVAAAVVRQISPLSAPADDLSPILEKLTKALERLDFRLKGIGGTGGSVVGSTVKNEVGTSLDTRKALTDTRYDYQVVGGNNAPLYVGTAAPGSPAAAAVWRVEKYSYDSGLLSLVQSAVGSWTNRAALFGGVVVPDPPPALSGSVSLGSGAVLTGSGIKDSGVTPGVYTATYGASY